MEKIVDITTKYSQLAQVKEDSIKILENELREINNSYICDIIQQFSEVVKVCPYFKTGDGYIKIDFVKTARVSGLFKYSPSIDVSGFYIRGINGVNGSKYFPYGYYDNCAGFLLSELIPITKEEFLKQIEIVTHEVINGLHYKPNQYYREENDLFGVLLTAARKGGIDIEYYPEINVTLIEKAE
jgi:hypothetical protein